MNETATRTDKINMPAVSSNPTSGGARTPANRSLVLNGRALVASLIIVAVVAPIVYAVHAMQVKRNAGTLFERAQRLESEGDLEAASRALYKYLQFRPDDGPARVLLARIFDQTAMTPSAKQRATEHYYAALGYFADQHELRVRLAEILLELGRTKEAEGECLQVLFGTTDVSESTLQRELKRYQAPLERPRLIADKPEAAVALRLLALARYQRLNLKQRVQPTDLLELIKAALAANPKDIELTNALVELYRDHLESPAAEQRVADADEAMAKLVSAHPTPSKALLALHRYRLKYELTNSDEPLTQAVELDPENVEVRLVCGNRAFSSKRFSEAEEHYRQVVRLAPKTLGGYAGLAQVALAQAKPQEAIAACESGLEETGDNGLSLNLLRVQALLADRQFEAAKDLLDKKLRPQLEKWGPTASIAQRTQFRDAIASLEAEHASATGDLLGAIATLKRMAVTRSAELDANDDLRVRSHNWNRLGRLYGQAGYWELAARAFEEQAQLENDSYAALVDAANAWNSAGRSDVAIESMQNALKSKSATAEGWARLAELEFERVVRSRNRDWTAFDQAFKAASATGESARLVMLDVQKKSVVGRSDEAVETLNTSLKKYEDELLSFAVLFSQSIGRLSDADGYLDRLRTAWPNRSVDVALVESELCRRRKQPEKAHEVLEQAVSTADSANRYRILRQLAAIDVAVDTARATPSLTTLANEYPQDVWPLEQLAELALTQNDLTGLQKHEEALQRLEGREGSLWRFYRGMRLARSGSGLNEAKSQELARLDRELGSLRPAWPGTHQLRGQILQQQGRFEDAAEAYQKAISLGAGNLSVFESLVAILYANNQMAEADLFLSRLQDVGYRSPGLDSLTPRLLLRTGEYEKAIAAARMGVKLRPKDAIAHNWLGQTLVIVAEKQESIAERQQLLTEAEEALERAVKLAPGNPRTWSALIWFCARHNRQRANKVVHELSQAGQLSELDRILTLGQAYQLLGNFTEAEKHLRKAVELSPKEPRVHERLARLYLSRAPEKVEPVLRRLLELEPTSKDARRLLAAHLASQGVDGKFEEAVGILKAGNAESADKRLRIALLVRRNGPGDLADARRLLTDLRRSKTPDPTDTLLLAVVNEIEGKIPEAQSLLRELNTQSDNAGFATALVEFQLRHNLLAEAETEIERLERLEPNSLRTLTLKVRCHRAAQHPLDEIGRDIEEHRRQATSSLSDQAEILRVQTGYASLYSKLELKEQAEAIYREMLREHPGPKTLRLFVLWLGSEGRLKEAVRVCLEHMPADTASIESIQILSSTLTWSAARGESYPEAEERLENLVAARSGDASLLLELGTLRHMQGQAQEAEKLYQRALELQPTNAMVRNNLAMLLMERPDTAPQALLQIEQAIGFAGSTPEMRDTYALVLSRTGRAEDARNILRSLITQFPRIPRYQFHLAVIEHHLNNAPEASRWLASAKKNRLGEDLMTPGERAMLSDLEKALSPPANGPSGDTSAEALGSNRGT